MTRLLRAKTGWLVALGLWLLAPLPARADIFSPGELAKPHAHLEGLSNCTQCHEGGERLSQKKCLACHAEVGKRITQAKGYHGRIPEQKRACEGCHHEHQGSGFALISWKPSKKAFPHAETGWSLEGAHRKVECDGCHEVRRIGAADVKAMLAKHPKKETYLGLPTTCASCHFDEHREQLDQDCAHCHTVQAFAPAPGFDHDESDFKLVGKHRKVDCEKCHERQNDDRTPSDAFPPPKKPDFSIYVDIPHASCQDCHDDVHDGRFGSRCSSCHTPEDWRKVKTPDGDRGFHDKTRFPLKGQHADVACKACHGPFPGQKAKFKGLAFQSCNPCHADAHLGQLTVAGGKQPRPCDDCHSVDGFLPVRFEVEQHKKTRYPLEGAHAAVACGECHPSKPALASRIPTAVQRDLRRKNRPERFSLVLLHLTSDSSRCESCHADPHAGQFDERLRKTGPQGRPAGCPQCHQLTSFADLRFDHQKDSRFPLTGKHAEVSCGACHPANIKPEGKGEKPAVRYRPLPTLCADCHADIHVGQLAQDGKTDCERCHQTTGWDKTLFVHQPPFTDYLLEGKHREAACDKCHPVQREAKVAAKGAKGAQAPLSTWRFKPTSRECQDCHTDFHQGAFRGFEP